MLKVELLQSLPENKQSIIYNKTAFSLTIKYVQVADIDYQGMYEFVDPSRNITKHHFGLAIRLSYSDDGTLLRNLSYSTERCVLFMLLTVTSITINIICSYIYIILSLILTIYFSVKIVIHCQNCMYSSK